MQSHHPRELVLERALSQASQICLVGLDLLHDLFECLPHRIVRSEEALVLRARGPLPASPPREGEVLREDHAVRPVLDPLVLGVEVGQDVLLELVVF